MGEIIDGVWHRERQATPSADGAFVRPDTVFRRRIEPGGRFAPESGGYHLYASLACPWAHRALIFRRLKELEAQIGLSVTFRLMGEDGWTFDPAEGVVAEPLGARAMHEIYARADPDYTGRVSVPVL